MEPVAVLAVSRTVSVAADAACVVAFAVSVALVVITASDGAACGPLIPPKGVERRLATK